jgi:hypothetical protein
MLQRRKLVAIGLFFLSTSLSCGAAYADTGRFAISPGVTTSGPGAELITKLTSNINFRFGVHGLSLDLDGTESDIDYDFEADLLCFSGLIDWHVFGNSFRITGGIVVNESEVDLEAEPAATLEIGDTTYTAAQIASLTGNLGFDNIAPYVGIGWGNPFTSKKRWGFMFDLGVAFTGPADLDLSASGPLAEDPTFLANLERERQDVEDDLDNFKFFPVLALRFFYRF